MHTHRRRSSTRPSCKSIGSGGQVSWRIPRFRSASGIPWKIPSPCGRSCRSPHATLFLSLTRTPRSDLDPRMTRRKGSGAASLHARAAEPVRGKVARMPSVTAADRYATERARSVRGTDHPPRKPCRLTHPPHSTATHGATFESKKRSFQSTLLSNISTFICIVLKILSFF